MVVAIVAGNLAGPMLAGFVGFGGGLVGAFVSGLVIYAIYALLTGTPMNLFGAVTFSIAVYASVIITGLVSGYLGFVSGLVATLVQAVFLSVVWSAIAPKSQVAKAPVKV